MLFLSPQALNQRLYLVPLEDEMESNIHLAGLTEKNYLRSNCFTFGLLGKFCGHCLYLEQLLQGPLFQALRMYFLKAILFNSVLKV